MDTKYVDLKDHQELKRDLDKLEQKLRSILDYYIEVGVLSEKRKHLAESLMRRERIEPQLGINTLKKTVVLDEEDKSWTSSKLGEHLEKKKSAAKVYILLEKMTSYHKHVEEKISELKLLKSGKTSQDSEVIEEEAVLEKMQEEKEDIEDKIIKFVIKNVLEGKNELFKVISMLEDNNTELEDIVSYLGERNNFLKGTVAALMLENQLLRQGESRQSDGPVDVMRREVIDNVSLMLPRNLRRSGSSASGAMSPEDPNNPFIPDDNLSLEGSTADSFALDAVMAGWQTDHISIQEHVKRIGRNLEAMEVNQMKLNLLKGYVQRHGAKKHINRNTLIDPSGGMSLWGNNTM